MSENSTLIINGRRFTGAELAVERRIFPDPGTNSLKMDSVFTALVRGSEFRRLLGKPEMNNGMAIRVETDGAVEFATFNPNFPSSCFDGENELALELEAVTCVNFGALVPGNWSGMAVVIGELNERVQAAAKSGLQYDPAAVPLMEKK
jgi:hypothetical protein